MATKTFLSIDLAMTHIIILHVVWVGLKREVACKRYFSILIAYDCD